eukprot:scaffold181723_cov15-Prasinocladus_malaysianus.AAC.1
MIYVYVWRQYLTCAASPAIDLIIGCDECMCACTEWGSGQQAEEIGNADYSQALTSAVLVQQVHFGIRGTP